MLNINNKLTAVTLAAAAIGGIAMAPSAASAELIEVEFTGLDLCFGLKGGSYYLRTEDSGGDPGSDVIDTMSVYVDGVLQGVVTGGQARMAISGFNNLPADGGSDTNDYGFGFFAVDFTPDDYSNGELNLGIDAEDATLFYEDNTVSMLLAGEGLIADQQQPLPFGIVFDETDTVQFTWSGTNITDLDTNDGRVINFKGRGAGTLLQEGSVPEPASLGLLGLAGLALVRRRR